MYNPRSQICCSKQVEEACIDWFIVVVEGPYVLQDGTVSLVMDASSEADYDQNLVDFSSASFQLIAYSQVTNL